MLTVNPHYVLGARSCAPCAVRSIQKKVLFAIYVTYYHSPVEKN